VSVLVLEEALAESSFVMERMSAANEGVNKAAERREKEA
jgi:hypothetical protein